MIKPLVIVAFAVSCFHVFANDRLDSLRQLLSEAPEDTAKVSLLNSFAIEIAPKNYDMAAVYALQAISLSKELGNNEYMANSLMALGKVEATEQNFLKSIDYFDRAREVYEQGGNDKGMANAYNELGIAYDYLGNYTKALECYLVPLRIYKDIGYKSGIANAYNNIGVIYYYQSSYQEALRYFDLAIEIYQEINEVSGIAMEYNNIGNIYSDQAKYDEALEYYFKGLEIDQKLEDKGGESISLVNIGDIYVDQGKYEDALVYLTKSLRAAESVKDKWAMTNSLTGLGNLYVKLEDYDKAIDLFLRSIDIAEQIGAKAELSETYNFLSKAYHLKKDMGKAYDFMKLYSDTKDTIFNKETSKMLVDMQTRYETEKKERQIELLGKEKEKQNYLIIGISIGLALIILIAILLYNRVSIRQKANDLLKKQKELVEHKNEEITDSLNYAKRIQQALLKIEDEDAKSLPEHFIFLRPKDIVSGDFYWVHSVDEYCYVTAADCTGHGVPGAFMSMLGIAFLNDTLNDLGALPPNVILKKLRERILKELMHKGVEEQPKDGMDMSLVKINTKTREVEWAGANNPLYIISKNQVEVNAEKIESDIQVESGLSLYELKGDKQPIGYFAWMKDFTNHKFKLSEGDALYLFSDGYADQFGGDKGKKYKYRPLKHLLLNLYHKDLPTQKNELIKEFDSWKRDYEQIDDVCVVGIKV